MIKNEAASIVATLSNLLEQGISHFFIFDTGSTDNTIALVGDFFKQHHLDGCIEQALFVDFATSRNRALELTERRFAHIPFVLMPDAEWYLSHGEDLLVFCEREKKKETPLYLLRMQMNTMEFSSARLFRTASHIRFSGVVHEAPSIHASIKVPDPVFFEVKTSKEGAEKSRRRWERDLQLLSTAYAKNHKDPRNAFYLGQTYECLGDVEQAYRVYQHRAKLPGWDEENFITLYRLGGLAWRMAQKKSAQEWSVAMDYYLKAFALRPHRIEPLLRIADYYWPDNAQTCYLFAHYAYSIPFPESDLLFVERYDYTYRRYEMMSRCAWYMGEFALGEQATLRALKMSPDTPHLRANLKLYQQKTGNKMDLSLL